MSQSKETTLMSVATIDQKLETIKATIANKRTTQQEALAEEQAMLEQVRILNTQRRKSATHEATAELRRLMPAFAEQCLTVNRAIVALFDSYDELEKSIAEIQEAYHRLRRNGTNVSNPIHGIEFDSPRWLHTLQSSIKSVKAITIKPHPTSTYAIGFVPLEQLPKAFPDCLINLQTEAPRDDK
ncbi:MAG: hypothetical protein F6J89_14410 [Symploca sp. SIO1C4]|uniref:Uncharacterized protein n=1 Tax=Symploca sp. SIO1C4 TaxID=2607765 RepID=A0A6B3NHK0_9CYAN|nr:hypothetical protein [Symploca sp. SIO1C4]